MLRELRSPAAAFFTWRDNDVASGWTPVLVTMGNENRLTGGCPCRSIGSPWNGLRAR
jgi:hypothetical protein